MGDGPAYTRRADLVGFVNGIPLLFIELKAAHKNVYDAFKDNLRDYKDTIPALFVPNGLIVLSNGSETKVGSLTASWEHFGDWKRAENEKEEGVISLETALRGIATPEKLLDLVENFCLFAQTGAGLSKIVARNHQYLGVNNAVEAVRNLGVNQGKLGVFWHTQGSGKSYSMAFFAGKVRRKLAGNWTFLVVTDRDDLDGQIYKTFADAGLTSEKESEVRAGSATHLQQLLREDHRMVFSLLQKFRTDKGATYPMLSERADVIVMTDEAHRGQYDTFALNIRNALPKAAFIGFTGTPLLVGEEKTREVFGDYVSVYDFAAAIADRATVPLFYENRIPELELTNTDLGTDFQDVLDEAALDDDKQAQLEREFAREYHLITREERLDVVGADIVSHFLGRVPLAKAMVVSIDKTTALRTLNAVRKHWQAHLEQLRASLDTVATPAERAEVERQIKWMEETDMALVVSSGQNEVAQFRARGLDIAPHRKRAQEEDLETRFKDARDPLRLVFVCAMWLTGFDVPSCATIYLDKPMKNHTLMQTIARANRVWEDKQNGLIVDYIGVFRNLQKALAIYARGVGQGAGALPVAPKAELVAALQKALGEARDFCASLEIVPSEIMKAQGFERIQKLGAAQEAILGEDARKKRFLMLAITVDRLFKAILPDPQANEFTAERAFFVVLSEKLRALEIGADLSDVEADLGALLDVSVGAQGLTPTFRIVGEGGWLDLSKLDVEAIKSYCAANGTRTTLEKLGATLAAQVAGMVRLNRTRGHFASEFARLMDEYNAGAHDVNAHFEALVRFAQSLGEEEKRHLTAGLSDEEGAIFDLLALPELKLTRAQEVEVKNAAQDLLLTLKNEKLVLEWRGRAQTRAAVRLAIEEVLDGTLPRVYEGAVFDNSVRAVWEHVYDSYYGAGKSIYRAI